MEDSSPGRSQCLGGVVEEVALDAELGLGGIRGSVDGGVGEGMVGGRRCDVGVLRSVRVAVHGRRTKDGFTPYNHRMDTLD